MEFDLNRQTTQLHIESSERTTGTAENFSLAFRIAIDNCAAFRVESYSIPHSYLSNFDPSQPQIPFFFSTSLDGPQTLLLDNVAYTDATFIAAANAYLLTLCPVTQPQFGLNGDKLTITIVAPHTFTLSASNLNQTPDWTGMLGFTTPLAAVASALADNPFNFSGPPTIYIHSIALSGQRDYQTQGESMTTSSMISSVPVSANSGGQIVSLYPGTLRPIPNRTLKFADFSLRRADGSLIDLRGQDWTVDITVVSDRAT